MKKQIDLVLACSDLGVCVDGSILGPEILSKELAREDINEIKVVNKSENYKKNKDIDNKKKNLNEINLVNRKIYENVKNSLDNLSCIIKQNVITSNNNPICHLLQ